MNLRRYQDQQGERRVEGMTRDEACERFKGRILHLATRMSAQAGSGCPFTAEDLVSYGVLGLLEAFDRFDPRQNTDFEAFASFRIRGQICDALLGEGGTTRRERQISRDIARATSMLSKEHGREPTHEELIARLGVAPDEYWRMRQIAVPITLVSLPERTTAELLPMSPEAPRRMLAADARQALRDAIGRLSERERTVVQLYYARDCSLAEIGAILEVSPSRVCQVLTEARTRLRKAIGVVDMELFAVEGAA